MALSEGAGVATGARHTDACNRDTDGDEEEGEEGEEGEEAEAEVGTRLEETETRLEETEAMTEEKNAHSRAGSGCLGSPRPPYPTGSAPLKSPC